MKREELLRSKEYWTTKIQLDLFELINEYMAKNKLNRTQLAEKLGVSKGYITQILNGDFDHKVSKLVELALAFDKVPILAYKDIRRHINEDRFGLEQEAKFSDVAYLGIVMGIHQQYARLDTEISKNFKFAQFKGYAIDPSESHSKNAIEFCYN